MAYLTHKYSLTQSFNKSGKNFQTRKIRFFSLPVRENLIQPSRHGPDFHRPQSQITIDSPDFHLRRSQNCLLGIWWRMVIRFLVQSITVLMWQIREIFDIRPFQGPYILKHWSNTPPGIHSHKCLTYHNEFPFLVRIKGNLFWLITKSCCMWKYTSEILFEHGILLLIKIRSARI